MSDEHQKPGATDPPRRAPLRLFEATGLELEYMIVDRESLAVRPLADRVLGAVGGSGEVEVELGPMAWSNELALHVVEIKTHGPVRSFDGVEALFADSVARIDEILAAHDARLMPTGMHPWMDPASELRLWPHEAGPIYRAFDRIFDCRGHGWANLQSMHVNLPFADDEEFARLHAAIRLVLPILPALAASSPVVDGRPAPVLDARMEFYRNNAARVPSVAGVVVPERVWSREDYEQQLLGGIYRDMAELDPEGILRHEWINARGAIARFDRGAIEIRVIDLQEHSCADLAVARLVVAVVQALAEERLAPLAEQQDWSEHALAAIFRRCLALAEGARVDLAYARALGWTGAEEPTAGELWRTLREVVGVELPGPSAEALEVILDRGSLARRILDDLGSDFDRDRLRSTYRKLCDCLTSQRSFLPAEN